ncbi:caspase family protein [Kitasatospora purpeofusca]|uniref:caspase family protein n=1 Tax=Kitasatospora purpeofusca TaxID=67352 RepID=UPI002A5ABFC3|nr:caspase family protein [Kitasatospora purpeofusca]MDY0814655.1 caspase family protein [Kitasatospora purpeofusca]
MGGFAALLIGASDYGQVGFTPLPFVPRDLERLDAALRARDFRVERPGAGEPISWNFVNGEVSRFLEEARRGETLLICLSGHGLHAQGVDYLIPEDLHRYRKPLWSGCVAIDWRSEVENTRAAQVLFLVDACREGVGGDTMGGGTVGWATGRAMTVKARRIAHLYACSPGGYAHFVAAGSDSFSLFSRAVQEVLLAHDGPLTLEQLGDAVQRRIEALHTGHRKPGAAQQVRVLTDADQEEFVVAGPLLAPAPVPGDDGSRTPEQSSDAADLQQLLGRAVLQWQAYGRTEPLAEYAVLGPTAELLDLADRLDPLAVTAMWDAAARRRPVVPLLALVAALCAGGRDVTAHRLLESAAVRPAPELPPVLTGLAGLTGLAALAAPDGHAGLPEETVDALRSTLLRALAALPADAWAVCVVELHRAGLAAAAARVSDEPRPVEDLPPLLAALDAEELPTEVRRLVRAAVARLGSRSVDGLLVALSRAGAVEARTTALAAVAEWSVEAVADWLRVTRGRGGLERDATAVVRTLVAQHRDVRSLPRLLREAGMSRYLDVFHEECARQEPRDLHRLLRGLSDGDVHASVRPDEDALTVVRLAAGLMVPKEAGELAVLLCGHGPDNLLELFLTELCAAPPERVAHILVRVRELPTVGRPDRDPVAAAVSVLGPRYPAEEVGPLLGALEQRRLPAVATRLRDTVVRDRSTAELLTVLARASLPERDLLLGRILALRREPGRLAELLDACGEERFASLGEPLARAVVAGCGDAELAGLGAELRARNGQAGERLLRDRLGSALSGPAPADHEGSGAADPAAVPPVAELVAALDGSGPGVRAAVDPVELLGTVLAAGPVERTGAVIEALRHRHSGARPPGARLVEALRVHAAALFAAARASGSEPGTSYLLDAFLGEPPLRGAELRALLAELARTGGGREAGLLLDRLGRSQPPPVVAGLLEALRDDDAFEVLCRAAAGRPVREVAEVLGNFPLERPRKGQAIQRFVEHMARATAPDRFAELLVELLAGRQGVLAGAVLRAARWTGSAEEIGRLLTAMDARGEEVRGRAMDALALELSALALELSAPLALGVLDQLHRNGAEQFGLPVLRAHARTVDSSALWVMLNERRWFRYAAALVDEAPTDAPVVAWYRQLRRTVHGLDRAGVLMAAGADGPVGELVERAVRGEPARAALTAAVLFREPADVVGLLAALADLPLPPPPAGPGAGPHSGPAPRTGPAERRAELWRILAAVRPAAELALILRMLRADGRLPEAQRIVDHLLADEPADRAAELLEASPPVDGPTDRDSAGGSKEVAELLAGRVLEGGSVAKVIGSLLRIGRPGSAWTLADALSSPGRTGAEVARAVASLVDAGLPPEFSHAMAVNVCRYRPPEHVADFLQYLDLSGHATALREAIATVASRAPDEGAALARLLEQRGHRELSARLSGPAEPPARPPWWRDRRGP